MPHIFDSVELTDLSSGSRTAGFSLNLKDMGLTPGHIFPLDIKVQTR